MRIEIELEVAPPNEHTSYHFGSAHTEWTIVPRVGDHIELVDGALEHGVVGRVVFTTRSIIRLQLVTVEPETPDLLDALRASSRWRSLT